MARAARAARVLLGLGLAACPASAPADDVAPVAAVQRQGERIVVPAGSPLRSRLATVRVATQVVPQQLSAPATVEADPSRLARIVPPLAGRVVRLLVRYGDPVRAGQPLLVMDSPDLVAAQTEYLKAKSAVAQAERTLVRQRDLAEHGIGAKRDLEQAETDRDVAANEQERARVRLRLLGIDPGRPGEPLTLASPIAGRVVDLNVAAGEVHNDPSTPLMTVADLSTVWLTASVQEKDLGKVRADDLATAVFAAYPAEPRTGRVFSVGDLLDPQTRTIKVRVSLANADRRLKPGMFATTTFTGPDVAEVVVPTTSLLLAGEHTVVFVEVAPWTFERRVVDTGAGVGDVTIVTRGVDPNARIVGKDAVLLQ